MNEYNRGNYAEALRLFRLAHDNNPDDKVISQNVKNAEAEVAKIEQERNAQKRREEEQRKQAEFRKQNQKMISLMMSLAPQQTSKPGEGIKQVIPPPKKPAGLSEAEWRELRRCEEKVTRLYEKRNTKGGLNDAEAQTFYAALQQRNALWSKAVSEPLTVVERDRLRLELPVASQRVVSADEALRSDRSEEGRAGPKTLSERDTIITNMLAEHSADKTEEIIDTKTGKLIKKTMGREAAERFENLVGYLRVAVRAREGAPEAGAETVDLIISKLPKPMSSRAEMAKEGGKVYSNVVYRAFNNFMDTVNKGFGLNIDKEKILKDVDENMTGQQKAVKVWTSFGEQ